MWLVGVFELKIVEALDGNVNSGHSICPQSCVLSYVYIPHPGPNISCVTEI